MLDINGALKAIGFGLLVLFFAVGVVKTCSSAADLKRPEHAFKLFIRFALAKAAVTYGLDLMLAIFQIIQGMVSTIITRSGLSGNSDAALPQEIIDKIDQVGFWDSIPLWAVTLLGGLFITVLSFVMILTVYRLTEIATRDGSTLMTTVLYDGSLPDVNGDTEITDVKITAVNNRNFELPNSGGNGFPMAAVGVALMFISLLFAVCFIRRSRKAQ